jgi:hypothetical protein
MTFIFYYSLYLKSFSVVSGYKLWNVYFILVGEMNSG